MVVTADVEMAVGAVTEAMTETSMAEAVRVVGRAVATAVVTAGAVGVRGRGGRARWRQRFERIINRALGGPVAVGARRPALTS